MNVKTIVEGYLPSHGCDGLCCEDCWCFIDDLFTCGKCGIRCRPGRRTDADTGPIISAEEAGNAEQDSAIGICPWCRQRIYEPFCDHCDKCEAFREHCAGFNQARRGEANNDD